MFAISTPPAIFAPGIISGPANDGSPTFTPDGKTLLFTRSGARAGVILESHLTGGTWSAPQIASFSGQWNDQHPSMAPDGSYLVFVSTRPVPGITKRVAHVWRVDRTPGGWSTPVHLPAEVNIGPLIFAPSVAADGTIYFLSIGEGRTFQLYRSRRAGDTYQTAEKLSFSSTKTADVDPEIAPDQSFMVFASSGRRSGDTNEHLYVVRNSGGAWGKVQPLHYDGEDASSNDNEPNIGPGGQTLYFASDRTLPPHFPRTPEEAEEDLQRIETWDNGLSNVWTIALQLP